MTYYDLHVHSNMTIGESSLDELAAFAKRLGLSGIGVAVSDFNEDSTLPKSIDGVEIISVAVIKANNLNELSEMVQRARGRAEVVAVHGGYYDINRAACENPLVDVLFHPEFQRPDSGIDHICARAAQENNVAIEINFHELLESYRKNRIKILSNIRKNVLLCRKYEAPLVTTSGALSKWDLRAGRDLASVPFLLGIELGKAIETVGAIPETIVKTNREKLAGRAWEGVRMVK